MPNKATEVLRAKINRETAKIPWKELQRFFAQGRVVFVSSELDLVEVAVGAADDRSAELESWMSDGKIATVTDEQARRWLELDALLWTVVVKPWVFIQEIDQPDGQRLH
jgi:hypothetical protein